LPVDINRLFSLGRQNAAMSSSNILGALGVLVRPQPAKPLGSLPAASKAAPVTIPQTVLPPRPDPTSRRGALLDISA